MKQLYQNVPELNINIQKWGCYYISLLNIYQDIAKHQLTYDVVNAIYVMSNRIFNNEGNRYLGKDCFVYDISGIIQVTSGLTGIEVYTELNNAVYNYLIGKFVRITNSGKRVTHFVRMDMDAKTVLEDPWLGGSRTAKVGKLDSLRKIYGRLLV